MKFFNSIILSDSTSISSDVVDVESIFDFLQKSKYTGYYSNSFQNIINSIVLERITSGKRAIIKDKFLNDHKKNNYKNLADYYSVNFYDNDQNLITNDISKFTSATVIPDIHGDIELLQKAVQWAKHQNNYIIFLGDITDYGSDPFGCIDIVYNLVISNRASFIVGNHDLKLFKFINGENVFINEGFKVTTSIFNAMKEEDKRKYRLRVNALYNMGQYHLNIKNTTLSHGGYDKRMSSINTKLYGKLSKYAMYGTDNFTQRDTKNIWTKQVEKNTIVIVGHTTVNYPKIIDNALGGRILFLDTGCGKGGTLSTCDIDLQTGKVRNLNMFSSTED